MTEERDPFLTNLFAEANPDLDSEEFVTAVMRAQSWRFRLSISGAAIGTVLLLLVLSWLFGIPIEEMTISIARGLSTSLIDLGESGAAWLLAPINNVASVLVLGGKAMRMTWKRISSISYA
jgi:hypothetical protein